MIDGKCTTSGLVFRGRNLLLPPGKYVDCTFIDCTISGADIEIHDSLFITWGGGSCIRLKDCNGVLISGCHGEPMYCAAPYTQRLNGDKFTKKYDSSFGTLLDPGEE